LAAFTSPHAGDDPEPQLALADRLSVIESARPSRIKVSMLTGEIHIPAQLPRQTAPERPSRRRVLRVVLVVAILLLILGLLVFAGLSGIAADPMTGT
jgi:ferric-dicitrate binding protein FerR (iron transport regulator)